MKDDSKGEVEVCEHSPTYIVTGISENWNQTELVKAYNGIVAGPECADSLQVFDALPENSGHRLVRLLETRQAVRLRDLTVHILRIGTLHNVLYLQVNTVQYTRTVSIWEQPTPWEKYLKKPKVWPAKKQKKNRWKILS